MEKLEIVDYFFNSVEAIKRSNKSIKPIMRKECKLCKKIYRGISGRVYLENFLCHLKQVHKQEYEDYNNGIKSKKFKQDTPNIKKSKTELSSEELALKFEKMIISSSMSLDIVTNAEFNEFINGLDPKFQIPKTEKLKRHFKRHYKTVVNNITDVVKEATYITTTFDLWITKSMVTYISLNAHFVSNSWNYEHKLLTFKRIFGVPNEATFKDEYELVLSNFGINNVVFLNITSNTIDLLKAFQLKFPNGEAGGLAVGDASSGENDYTFDEFLDINKYLGAETCKIKGIINHSESFIHTLMHLIKESIRNDQPLIQTLQICREILSHMFVSFLSNEKLKLLIQNCLQARQLSDIHLFQQFFEIYEEISEILKETEKESWLLSQTQLEILKEFVEILQPFQEAIDFLFSDSLSFISKCLPTTIALRQHLQLLSAVHLKSLIEALVSSLDKQLKELYEDPVHVISTILHPAWKMTPFIHVDMQAKAKQILIDELCKLSGTSSDENSSEETKTDNTEPNAKKSRLSLMFQVVLSNNQPVRPGYEIEVDSYLIDDQIEDHSNPLVFWKLNEAKYSHLSSLSKKYFSIPAISMPIEKIRSLTDDIIKDRSNFITGDIISQNAILKYNLDLF